MANVRSVQHFWAKRKVDFPVVMRCPNCLAMIVNSHIDLNKENVRMVDQFEERRREDFRAAMKKRKNPLIRSHSACVPRKPRKNSRIK